MCKVYTEVGGIKQLYYVCSPVRKMIHSLKLVDYLHVQAQPMVQLLRNNFQLPKLSKRFEKVRKCYAEGCTTEGMKVCKIYSQVGK